MLEPQLLAGFLASWSHGWPLMHESMMLGQASPVAHLLTKTSLVKAVKCANAKTKSGQVFFNFNET